MLPLKTFNPVQTGLQCDFTYNTFNDYVRIHVLKHNKYRRHYDNDLAYTYACWFICREVTIRLYMLLYYRKQLSDPAYDFAKTLRSYKTFLYSTSTNKILKSTVSVSTK